MTTHNLLFALPACIATVCMLALALVSFFSSRRAAARAFTAFCLLVFIWCFGATAEQLSWTLEAQRSWAKLEHVGIAWVGLAWLTFCAAYTGTLRRPVRRYWPLALIPLLSLGLVLTNEAHGLIWSAVRWNGTDAIFEHGWWFRYVYLPYGYAMVCLGSLLLMRSFLSATASYRRSLLYLILSSCVPLVLNATYLAGYRRLPFDLTPLGFALSGVLVGWTLLRNRFLQREPVSLEQLLQHLPDAVLLLDLKGRILEANVAARKLFGENMRGRQLLEWVPDLSSFLLDPETGETVYRRNGRSYRVRSELLARGGAAPVARLLGLRDVTEYVRATEQLEQQSAFQEALIGGMRGLLEADTGPKAYQNLLEQAMQIISGTEAGSVVLQKTDGRFGYVASVGFDPELLKQVTFEKHELFYGGALIDRPTLITDIDEVNTQTLPCEKAELIRAAGFGKQYRVSLAMPVFLDGELIALVSLDNASNPGAFGPEARRLAEVFSKHVATVLQKARFKEQLEEAVRGQTLLAQIERLLLETPELKNFFPLLASALYQTEGLGVDQVAIYERQARGLTAHIYCAEEERRTQLARELGEAGLLTPKAEGTDLLSCCIADRTPRYFADVLQEDGWIRLESNPARTVFYCPLLQGGEVWGVLEFSSDTRHAFSEATRELLLNIVQSTELALAREHDRARLELELARMNSVVSSAEIMRAFRTHRHVFEEAARAVLQRTRADLSALFWYDARVEGLVLEVGFRSRNGHLTPIPHHTLLREPSLSGRVMDENTTLRIDDAHLLTEYIKNRGDSFPLRAYVGTPLHDEDNRPVGVLVALKQDDGAGFEAGDVAFLEAIAQATSAATIRLKLLAEAEDRANAYEELYRTAERQHHELALLDRVRTALARELDLSQVAQRLVAVLSDSLGYAAVRVYWLEDKTLVLREQAGTGKRRGDAMVRQAVLNRAVEEGQPVLSEIRNAGSGESAGSSTWKIAIPLYGHAKILGVLSVESHVGTELAEEDLKLLTALSEQVSIAVERALLYTYIRESETRFRLLAENMSDLVCLHTPEGRLSYVSPSSEAVLGLTAETLLGEPLIPHLHPEDVPILDEHLAHGFLLGSAPLRLRLCRADGVYRWFDTVIHPLYDDSGELRGFTSASRDVTDRRAMEERLRHAAHYDSLTELPNRSLFLERLERALEVQRTGDETAVLFIDLDRFKMVNDSLGHQAGDALLKRLSARLLAHVRPDDTVARLSGDEFCVLLEGLTSQETALQIAERLQQAVAAPFLLEGRECFVSASIGVAFAEGVPHAAELLRNADIAMYRAKHGGRDALVVFDPSMHQETVDRLTLEGSLRHALEHRELNLHYQPIFNLQTGALTGFEALCRWKLAGRAVPPDTFIPIAEETGLITRLDAWAVRASCEQLVAWQREYDLPPSVGVSVNLASRSFEQDDLMPMLARALAETGLSASSLTLELTERTVMRDSAEAVEVLQALRRLGVRVQVDDFGTGYSSLRYLHTLPLDSLKIDRSFIAQLTTGQPGMVVRSILALAQGLELQVVAEGIETSEQLEQLRGLSCTYGQGYLLSRPLAPADLEAAILRPKRWTFPGRPIRESSALDLRN